MLLAAFLFLAPDGAAQNPSPTLTTLYSFRGQYSDAPDGWKPAGVVIGSGGKLYGTTQFGGAYGGCLPGCGKDGANPTAGVVVGNDGVLYGTASDNDYEPRAGVAIGESGVLYGTTLFGGTAGASTVFALSPPASPGGSWSEKTLHSFAGSPGDGYEPNGLMIGPDRVPIAPLKGAELVPAPPLLVVVGRCSP